MNRREAIKAAGAGAVVAAAGAIGCNALPTLSPEAPAPDPEPTEPGMLANGWMKLDWFDEPAFVEFPNPDPSIVQSMMCYRLSDRETGQWHETAMFAGRSRQEVADVAYERAKMWRGPVDVMVYECKQQEAAS